MGKQAGRPSRTGYDQDQVFRSLDAAQMPNVRTMTAGANDSAMQGQVPIRMRPRPITGAAYAGGGLKKRVMAGNANHLYYGYHSNRQSVIEGNAGMAGAKNYMTVSREKRSRLLSGINQSA